MKQTVYNTKDNNKMLTIAIGNFDGVHIGHQKLINQTKIYNDTSSAILTFWPHPISIFSNKQYDTLMNINDKVDIINNMGVDFIFVEDFNQEFAAFSILDFINYLKNLNVKRVVVGADFRFATKGSGSVNDLNQYFETIVIDDVVKDNIRISSSYIKELLDQNDILKVTNLLTRTYQVSGIVVDGNKVGRKLGFPTANINVGNYYLPNNGVYYVKVNIKNKIYHGLANIGNNPTINQSIVRKLEVYILDFNDFIYNLEVKIDFVAFLREEIKFANKELLIEQMKKDEIYVRNTFL